ncbi:YaiI/YqxD family protein [Ponticaulis sp.]|uniref:YaiI/YqxD family protein n=1 Tax=Ponticaulis sp. TaxID=2020902 RepID=UPI000B6F5428|nr:YaiI/YqxD family protein [Ponticaulis sp.]MAI91899.1 hypothetical protein [Ponticaulis sp.]OUX96579.1 MAG: hypothetical protein CBB65_15825 [Hyphomonadaceae bacterium TMED5]|tara:strand:- start:18844 stop:19293 length:450 start_codon:yes stop_codon:yes gene_type:complete
MIIYVDADACPVKNEIYKVAERHSAQVFVVSNSFLQVPHLPFIQQQVVDAGPDEADNWIAERATASDIVITADILLAERCLENDASVLQPNGRAYTKANIASAVATRALMEQLRSTGEQVGGAKPFSARERSFFLQALHEKCVRLKAGR